MNDNVVSPLFREAKLMDFYAGTSEIRHMLIGKKRMGAIG